MNKAFNFIKSVLTGSETRNRRKSVYVRSTPILAGPGILTGSGRGGLMRLFFTRIALSI